MEAISKKNEKLFITLVWIIGVIVLWEVGAWLLQDVFHDNMARQKLPYLHDVAAAFISNFGSLLNSGMVTLSKASIGFLIGGSIGFLMAVFMSWSGVVEKITFPYLIVSQMIPILALAPIIYSIVKDGDLSRVIIAAYITFFPVAVNVLSGLRSVEKDRIDLLKSYAANKPTIYIKLMLPSSLPYLYAGLKIAAPRSITAAILVEMLGTNEGIGVKMLYTLYYGAGAIHMFWASVITAALLCIFGYAVVAALEKLFIPWEKAALKKEGAE